MIRPSDLCNIIRGTVYLARNTNTKLSPREREMVEILEKALTAMEAPHSTDGRLMNAIADVVQSQQPMPRPLAGREFRTVDHAMFARGVRALKDIFPIEHVAARSAPHEVDGPSHIV